MAAPLILVEAQPRRAADGVAETVRLAGGGGAKPYFYGDAHWRAGLTGLPRIVASIEFDGTDLGTGSVPQAMQLRWAPAGQAGVAALAAYHWVDAAITVRVGPEGALPPVLTTGKVLSATVSDGALVIALADPAADLRKPILTARFAGTGSVEGPVELEGRIKPRAWGRVFNVEGFVLDAANTIHCFGDPARPWSAFVQVRDKGAAAAAMNVLAWQGSVAATFAALQAAAAPQGGCVACPSIACVKWWTQPAGALCADIHGEVGAGYVETAAEIAQRIAATVSTVAFAAGTIAAAASARSAPVGWYQAEENGTAAAALDKILSDVSLLWMLDDTGIVIRRWEWGASVASALSLDVSRIAAFKPVKSRRLGYRRNLHKMNRDAIAGIVFVGSGPSFPGDLVDSSGAPLTEADIVTSEGTSNNTDNVGELPSNDLILDSFGGNIAAFIAQTRSLADRLRGEERAHLAGVPLGVRLETESEARDALAQGVTRMSAAVDSQFGRVAAQIQSEVTARTNGDQAEASSRLQLAVQLGQDLTAAITAVTTGYQAADAAEAAARLLLAADLGDVAAALAVEVGARQDADSDEAAARLALAAEIDDVAAALLVEVGAREDGDAAEAGARLALSAEVDGIAAALAVEVIAREDGDEAEALARLALGTTVAGHESTLTILNQILVEPDGSAVGKAMLALNVDGNIVGQYLTNDGTVGDLTFLFDNVIFKLPDGSIAMTVGSDVDGPLVDAPRMRVGLLDVGAVKTDNLAANAATQYDVENGWSFGLTVGAGTNGPSVSLVTTGGPVRADVTFKIIGAFISGTPANGVVQLMRQLNGGTPTIIGPTFDFQANQGRSYQSFFILDTPPAGSTVTYYLRGSRDSGDGSLVVSDGQILAVEFKK